MYQSFEEVNFDIITHWEYKLTWYSVMSTLRLLLFSILHIVHSSPKETYNFYLREQWTYWPESFSWVHWPRISKTEYFKKRYVSFNEECIFELSVSDLRTYLYHYHYHCVHWYLIHGHSRKSGPWTCTCILDWIGLNSSGFFHHKKGSNWAGVL